MDEHKDIILLFIVGIILFVGLTFGFMHFIKKTFTKTYPTGFLNSSELKREQKERMENQARQQKQMMERLKRESKRH